MRKYISSFFALFSYEAAYEAAYVKNVRWFQITNEGFFTYLAIM